MSHKILNDNIERRFHGYSVTHPVADIIKENLVGTRFYAVSRNADLLGKIPQYLVMTPDVRNVYVACFYLRPHETTLVALYNVREPRLHANATALTYTNHFWERMTIQTIEGQPDFTVARPLFLHADLGKYQMQLMHTASSVHENSTSEYRVYQNDNLVMHVYGPLVAKMAPIETAFRLMKYSNAVVVSYMQIQ